MSILIILLVIFTVGIIYGFYHLKYQGKIKKIITDESTELSIHVETPPPKDDDEENSLPLEKSINSDGEPDFNQRESPTNIERGWLPGRFESV